VLQSNVTVTLRLVQEGQPVPGAQVFLVVRYRTVAERQPPGTGAARTDAAGTASITFNIDSATRDYPVAVEVTAVVDSQEVTFATSFTPR
jgi:hypothetical protein